VRFVIVYRNHLAGMKNFSNFRVFLSQKIRTLKKQNIYSGDITAIDQLLKDPKDVVIFSHFNPDGDAIGSALALHLFLKKLGHSAHVIIPNPFPTFLSWMKGSEDVVIYEKNPDKSIELIRNAGVLFILDFNAPGRIKKAEKSLLAASGIKILIDHHPQPEIFTDYLFSDTEVSSTAELVYEFMVALNKEKDIDQDIATSIYTGIMTDTGNFSYNSSRKRTFEIVAELMTYNINKNYIYSKVYDNFSHNRMKLLGYCLHEKMKVFPESGASYICLNLKELEDFHYEPGDTEGFVNYPLSIKGIVFSAFFSEQKGVIRISLRSKGSFAVNKIAEKYFKGGGHINAAGGESRLTMEATILKFKAILKDYAEEILKSAENSETNSAG
jgi:bifunctional oligoribonuclease and PAP phosphatase NrnA